jgi:DNA-binding NarL/FixJ family response regulator
MKNVLIEDDHPVFLQGITLIIKLSPLDITIDTAANLAETKQILKQQQPDLLLLDLLLPDTNDFDGLEELMATYPSLPIAIISSSEDTKHIQTAFNYGVKGYIFKTLDLDELLAAIEKILTGKCYFPESYCLPESENALAEKNKLTPRQIEILNLVRQGLSNKKISKKLYIAESTVKKHLNSIFKILNVKNRLQAVQCIHQQKTNKN